jgi:hypothetical protein
MDLLTWAPFILSILVVVLGLVFISQAGGLYGLGIALFAIGIIFGFWSIKRHFDRIDAGRH